jgi:hypothetical protein
VSVLAFIGGIAVGVVLTLQIRPGVESSCCARVARAVRDKAAGCPACQSLGDALDIWGHTPGLLDQFGL